MKKELKPETGSMIAEELKKIADDPMSVLIDSGLINMEKGLEVMYNNKKLLVKLNITANQCNLPSDYAEAVDIWWEQGDKAKL